MKSKKVLRQEIIEMLSKKDFPRKELVGILEYMDNIGKPKEPPKDESLRIPDYIRSMYPDAFIGKTHYDTLMQKIVWEEDE